MDDSRLGRLLLVPAAMVFLVAPAPARCAPLPPSAAEIPEPFWTAVPPGACEGAAYRQFDFWIGDWEVVSRRLIERKGQDTWKEGKGKSRVRAVLDGCVIEENFEGVSDAPIRGNTVSKFDPKIGKWRQVWVDDRGNWLEFAGGFERGTMLISRKVVTGGKKVLHRIVYFNITSYAFDLSVERSFNDGKSWQGYWILKYRRI